jgi:hypothetical protein
MIAKRRALISGARRKNKTRMSIRLALNRVENINSSMPET